MGSKTFVNHFLKLVLKLTCLPVLPSLHNSLPRPLVVTPDASAWMSCTAPGGDLLP